MTVKHLDDFEALDALGIELQVTNFAIVAPRRVGKTGREHCHYQKTAHGDPLVILHRYRNLDTWRAQMVARRLSSPISTICDVIDRTVPNESR